jgi:hypothetical protein
MPMWLQAVFGGIVGASDFITQHWIGIIIFFAFWELWKISSLLREANSRLERIGGHLSCIEDYTDALSADDRERQSEDAEAEYLRGFSGTEERQAAKS